MSEDSENYTSDHGVEGSDSSENGNEGFDRKARGTEPTNHSVESAGTPDLQVSSGEGVTGCDGNPEEQTLVDQLESPVSTEEELNGFVDVKSPVDAPHVSVVVDGETESGNGEDEVLVDHVSSENDHVSSENEDSVAIFETPASVDQGSSVSPVDHENRILVNSDNSAQRNLDDGNLTDEAGKDDMFVDAPEHLTVYDGKQVHHLVDELARLQTVLDKTVSEKETMALEYKGERETFSRELTNLFHQLEVLTNQQLLPVENDDGLVDHIFRAETRDGEYETRVSVTPLQVMISDCSKFALFLKSALDERSQSEGTVRELHAVLLTKDEEIEDLNAKVMELSLSCDIVVSYLNSIQNIWSQSLKESSEVWFERDLHLEVATKKLLASLPVVVQQDELVDDSVAERISHAEKGFSLMTENYNQILSEIDQLKQCLTEVRPDFGMPEEKECGIVIGVACEELLECKRRELNLGEKLNQLEDENRKLLEQLDKEREMIEMANAEVSKTKMVLEQEKIKSTTIKEKLSLAVTKGKALVQQRDSYKQSLAEKASEIEKYLLELQEKSNALKAAEVSMEELVKSQNLVAFLQESLSQRDMVIKEIEEVMSPTNIPEQLQSVGIIERVRWIVDRRNVLESISMDFHKLKEALSLVDLPESVSYSDMETQVNWLGKSFFQAKDDKIKLQEEIGSTKEAIAALESELMEARNEIDHLTASLLTEKQEKDSFQIGLEDLTHKYEGIVEKEHRVSYEKDQMMRMFLNASGIPRDDQGRFDFSSSDIAMLIEKCIGKIKEQITELFESSHVEADLFERTQCLLYIRDQELNLCQKILEEEMLERSEVTNLSNELRKASHEVVALKDERDSLQKDLERSEEKSTLLREKLSMAVKKGKGLVQEREGLKHSLEEKNAEIEKLKLELQRQESVVNECRDQMSRLSSDLERIPILESDLDIMKDQRDQLEQFLVESNNMLQRVIETIDGIVLPVDTVFGEPVEKVKWLAENFHEYRVGKSHAEQELKKVKEESSSLGNKLAEAYTSMKSLEDALSQSEKNISLLAQEKSEIEIGKAYVEQELERAKEEAGTQTSRFAEAFATINSLEDALSAAEKNISVLVDEKNDAQIGRTSAELDLKGVTEEADFQSGKLAEAYEMIKSHEDALSQMEKKVALLTEEKNDAVSGKTYLEKLLDKVKEEGGSQGSMLADAQTTIKSLEDKFLQAENRNFVLVDEKKKTEQEIITLHAKLTASMEELAGACDSLEGRSLELLGHLNHLQRLVKDEALLSLLMQCFKRKFESLRDMNFLFRDIHNHFAEKGSEWLQVSPVIEKDPYVATLFPADLDIIPNLISDNNEMSAADLDNVWSYFPKMLEGLNSKNKHLQDKFEGFSSSMDEFIAILLRALQAMRDEVFVTLEHMESLNQKVKSLEAYKQFQENTVSTLENDITVLLSACNDATQELQFVVGNNIQDLRSISELEKLNHNFYSGAREAVGDAVEEPKESVTGTKYAEAADNLLLTARKVQTQMEQFANIKNATIEDLQNKLKEMKVISQNVMQEKDLHQERVSKLESDLEALQNFCSEMRLKLDDYQAKEDMLRDRELELSSLQNTLTMKEQEADMHILSEGEMKTLFDKINAIEIPFKESELEITEPHSSAFVNKLFYIIDTVVRLQHQLDILSHEKEELESDLAIQVREIEHFKGAESSINNRDSEEMKNDIAELALDLEKIIRLLGGSELVEDKKAVGVRGLFSVLEKLGMALIVESENSKLKSQDLSAKLNGSQKVVEELSIKVKLLEDSIHGRPGQSDTVQERSIFDATTLSTGSEISEIEDMGPLGNKSISPVPSAAHVRSMWKGSSDHLALNIDSESDRLINHPETDEDKGHVFKSLNTSGLIPKQGKIVADRIDGIWVSGSRALMSHPRARIGLISYWLFLQIWVLASLL